MKAARSALRAGSTSPEHVPATHASLVVSGLPSSQAVPSGFGGGGERAVTRAHGAAPWPPARGLQNARSGPADAPAAQVAGPGDAVPPPHSVASGPVGV